MPSLPKLILHLFISALLTLLSQIGGFIWIFVYGYFFIKNKAISKTYRIAIFFLIYLFFSAVLIPLIAPLTGRVSLPLRGDSGVRPHNYLTVLLNRHYVRPALRDNLIKVASKIKEQNASLQLRYLDANFPFIDGFPLLPHLSHNDGKKVDICYYYTMNNKRSNLKPSCSGYGAFVNPLPGEDNQPSVCRQSGYWQYDYPKYLTLGTRSDLEFDPVTTRRLVDLLLTQKGAEKLFIEPHLKERMRLSGSKIRYQGCASVRHDDHIHFQID